MGAKHIGELEQMVLLAISRLGADAYGMSVLRELATRADRATNAELVDRIVTDWSVSVTRSEAGRLVREHRVPAGVVRNLEEVMNDPHMHERGMLRHVDHRDMGRVVLPNSPLRFPDLGQVELEPYPRLGEHNAEVYGDLLGLSDDELAALRREGVI